LKYARVGRAFLTRRLGAVLPSGVPETVCFTPEALLPTRRVLVADPDEIVVFIASHILSRYDFAVVTATSSAALANEPDGFHAIVVSAAIVAELPKRFDPSRTVILGEAIEGFKPFARLRKPLELDQLVTTVTACANRR
jgi:CheY-like chemotaxis protein